MDLLTDLEFLVALAFVIGIVVIAGLFTSAAKSAPYVPTPEPVAREMLAIAGAGPGDVVYDLGSGDGRLAIAAARDFDAARAVGIEIDFRLVRRSRRNAAAAGVTDRVTFVEGNFLKQDFSGATIVTVFMLPAVNLKLRPRLLGELKPGTRIVMHQFDLDDWKPDGRSKVGRHDVFMWVVPADVAGAWCWSDAGHSYRLTLAQTWQEVEGVLAIDGREQPVRDARLVSNRLTFMVVDDDNADDGLQFEGQVSGDRMRATFADCEVTPRRA